MKNIIKIGTRKSKLALIQTDIVKDKIKKAFPEIEVEIVKIDTKRDQILDKSLTSFGGKGVFTAELEAELLSGAVDIAVHSAKDMPMDFPEGLGIGAVLDRADVRDTFVTTTGKKLEELDGKVVTEDDYSIMSEANSKIMALQNDIGIAQINQDIYEQLKSKFDEKVVRDEFILDNEYIEYKSTVKQFESFNSNYQVENKVYPSEILLSQIDVEIKEYNNLQKKLSDEKLTYKEQSLILKILLIIITFGIYLIIIKVK